MFTDITEEFVFSCENIDMFIADLTDRTDENKPLTPLQLFLLNCSDGIWMDFYLVEKRDNPGENWCGLCVASVSQPVGVPGLDWYRGKGSGMRCCLPQCLF